MRSYAPPTPLSRADAEAALQSTDAAALGQTLIDIAYFEADGAWALAQALAFTRHADEDVANAATSAIGHIARIHRSLDMAEAILRLEELRANRGTREAARFALEDIAKFVRLR